ncbi:MAG: Dihydrodipicolinate reductase [Firmicutes bacterium]|nr:Dihydrodipicolinate reductase [Bacillota bacterium]
MDKTKIGIFGFGKTGKIVANEFLKDSLFSLRWVVRKSCEGRHKFASRLLGYPHKSGTIFSIDDINDEFFSERPVDAIVDFSDSKALHLYKRAAEMSIPIISAISKYEKEESDLLKLFSESTAVLYSPNITLGINVLMVAAQILQKIAPHADIEIVEEHFKGKKEVSGTAKKIANTLRLDLEKHVHSIRVGDIVGRHEIIFGLPNQTIRLSHESIGRSAFGEGAIFAVNFLREQRPGLYSMEAVIADMFRKNIPVC